MFRKIALTAALAALASAPLAAELPRGADAPGFTARGAKAGKPMSFNLKKALRNGPVVLYFFPKAYTQGCTLEANAFAEAMDDFRAAGATVVGMSNDDLPTLIRFSREECRDEFAVASASRALVKAYDVDLVREGKSTGLTNRVSYVIGQDGRIAFVHSDLDWRDHVRLTLARVRAMKAARR